MNLRIYPQRPSGGCFPKSANFRPILSMLSIRLNPDIERRLSELAKRTGRTKTYYARELIEGNIEDLEDRYLA